MTGPTDLFPMVAYCRDHDRTEHLGGAQSQLIMQLAEGFFTKEDWVIIQSRLRDRVKDANQDRIRAHGFKGTTHLLTLHCARSTLELIQAAPSVATGSI
jgi:hypothetical protein